MVRQVVEGESCRIQCFRLLWTCLNLWYQCKNSNQQNEKSEKYKIKLQKTGLSPATLILGLRWLFSCMVTSTKRVNLPGFGKIYLNTQKELEDGVNAAYSPCGYGMVPSEEITYHLW